MSQFRGYQEGGPRNQSVGCGQIEGGGPQAIGFTFLRCRVSERSNAKPSDDELHYPAPADIPPIRVYLKSIRLRTAGGGKGSRVPMDGGRSAFLECDRGRTWPHFNVSFKPESHGRKTCCYLAT